jgi:hypothetical protein
MDDTLKMILERLRSIDQRFDGIEAILKGRCKSHYTVDEVSKITGRSPYTVRTHWIGTGLLKANRVQRGKYLVETRELERFMATSRGAPTRKSNPLATTKSVKALTSRFKGRVRLLYPMDVAKQVERAIEQQKLYAKLGIED